jgi:hypothetical protein
MKVGDLVKFKSSSSRSIGLVIKTGVYVGNTDVKICWFGTKFNGRGIYNEYSKTLEVISENNNN